MFSTKLRIIFELSSINFNKIFYFRNFELIPKFYKYLGGVKITELLELKDIDIIKKKFMEHFNYEISDNLDADIEDIELNSFDSEIEISPIEKFK